MVAALFWEMQIYTAPSRMWLQAWRNAVLCTFRAMLFTSRLCAHKPSHCQYNPSRVQCFIWPLYSQRSDWCLDCGSDAATPHSLHLLACAASSAFTFLRRGVSAPLCTSFTHSVTSRSILVGFLPWNCSHLEVFVFFTFDKGWYEYSYLRTYSNNFPSSLFMFIPQ